MPGMVGWINHQYGGDPLTPASVQVLQTPSHQKVEPVSGIRDGKITLLHPQVNPLGYGSLSDKRSGCTVAFWGEFYGSAFQFCETGTDVCGVLLRLLEEHPLDALRNFDGSFILFYQNEQSQLLATDRIASRPLFYMQAGRTLVFGPELKVFSCLAQGKPQLSQSAMVEYLVNGQCLRDTCYYEGVRLLPPGRYLQIKAGLLHEGEYTSFVPVDSDIPDRGLPEYREELAQLLRSAVRDRQKKLEKAVIPISGGYDSRGILACVREFYSGRLQTVSWGTDETTPGADAMVGRSVAAYFGCDHMFLQRRSDSIVEGMERTLQLMDAANADSIAHPHEPELIEKLRTMGHPILFRGDECFGYGPPAVSPMEAARRVGLAELSHYPSLHRLFHSHLVPSLIEQQRETLREIFDGCPVKGTWTGVKDWLYLYQRLFRNLNFSHYAKLAFVEARNPWLARDILRFCEKLPEHYRYDKALFRDTLAFMFPELMQKVPIACHHSLENWGTVLRADRAFGRFARKHLVECRSPLHELWNPTALGLLIDRFYAGKSIESARVCTLSRVKSFVRTRIPPLYRALKKAPPRALAVASFAPDQVIGRLLTLKLWCDRYA